MQQLFQGKVKTPRNTRPTGQCATVKKDDALPWVDHLLYIFARRKAACSPFAMHTYPHISLLEFKNVFRSESTHRGLRMLRP